MIIATVHWQSGTNNLRFFIREAICLRASLLRTIFDIGMCLDSKLENNEFAFPDNFWAKVSECLSAGTINESKYQEITLNNLLGISTPFSNDVIIFKLIQESFFYSCFVREILNQKSQLLGTPFYRYFECFFIES